MFHLSPSLSLPLFSAAVLNPDVAQYSVAYLSKFDNNLRFWIYRRSQLCLIKCLLTLQGQALGLICFCHGDRYCWVQLTAWFCTGNCKYLAYILHHAIH